MEAKASGIWLWSGRFGFLGKGVHVELLRCSDAAVLAVLSRGAVVKVTGLYAEWTVAKV